MRPIPDRLTPLECWPVPVHNTRQEGVLISRDMPGEHL